MSSESAQDLEQLLAATPYRAVAPLSAGGMGELYEAIGADGERVAVKVLRASLVHQADMVDRMRVEGEVLEVLRHPSIVAFRGRGFTASGRPYVAMERLDGTTLLTELRQRGSLPLAEAIHVTRQVLSALRCAHAAGIVHRDVKPENVMVSKQGGAPPAIKLLDFGVAKVTRGPGQIVTPLAFPTMDGACVGTPRYASPEQARGTSVDRRTDIYAAGILLYTLVAGRGPFDEIKGAGNVLKAHISEEPPPPSRFTRCPIPAPLESVILRAIAKDPNDRFDDAAAFSRELLVTMAKMCLPIDRMTRPADIALALTEPRTRCSSPPQSAPTVAARKIRPPSPVVRSGNVAAEPARDPPVSGAEVLLSAAAFAAVACGVAMWFVR
jgi:serine/threonine-protein kinase